MSLAPSAEPACAPSLALLGLEPIRAAVEYLRMRLMDSSGLPQGDGHPVVIFPGLAGDSNSVAPLTSFCRSLGYAAVDWGRGMNTGPAGDVEPWLDGLAEHVRELTAAHDDTITLIGWSLGGIYAREVAKRVPDRVRQVISVGTPFACDAAQTNAGLLYRVLNGRRPEIEEGLKQRLRQAPDAPYCSIYSRSDGVVSWRACVQEPTGAHIENVEVDGSHCGLCWNPAVLNVIAERLHRVSAPRAARITLGRDRPVGPAALKATRVAARAA